MTIVRPAVATDAERIALLLGQLGYPTPPEDIPARVASIEREKALSSLRRMITTALSVWRVDHVIPHSTRVPRLPTSPRS